MGGLSTLAATRGPRWPLFFFFNDTATTEIYTLSLHDALPICITAVIVRPRMAMKEARQGLQLKGRRSEEHTSELQSRLHLVCRLLLEKKKPTPATQTLQHEPHRSAHRHSPPRPARHAEGAPST